MRFGLLTAAALMSSVVAISRTASADSMDPALERLVHSATVPGAPCSAAGRYISGTGPCVFDDAGFKKIISQYGFAFAPLAMYQARTTGFGGFQVAIQAGYTSIDKDADYWQNGTQGPTDPNTGQYSVRNNSPDSWLQVYNLNLRKGLPFGFELGVNIGYMAHTSLWSGGADVRWALLEGFRTGLLGILPDLSVGAGVRTITGTPEFQLTVASGDAGISKPIPIADSSVFTPYIGYQFIRIFGDSGLIDPTPNTDAVGYCNYQGQRVPGGWPGDDAAHTMGPYNGQPVCGSGNSTDGSPDDLNNTKIFQKTRITRHRIVAGVSYRYEMVVIGGQFITDIVDPSSANSGAEAEALSNVPRQNTIAIQLGTAF
jgi:hypothetical protein